MLLQQKELLLHTSLNSINVCVCVCVFIQMQSSFYMVMTVFELKR